MSAESVQPRAVPTGIRLMPDSSRVVARLFVPGLEDVGPTGSRASAVIGRLLSLDEKDCVDALEDVLGELLADADALPLAEDAGEYDFYEWAAGAAGETEAVGS